MDPASSFLAGHVAGKVLDKLGALFSTRVIGRWSRHRAEVFFDQFCAEITGGEAYLTPNEVEARLEQLFADEVRSEVMFDAYRRVTLSKSRDLGPRVIALLTAKIVAEQRYASEVEDAILLAAENLNDQELLEALKFVRDEQQKLASGSATTSILRIKWSDDKFDSSWRKMSSISTGPLDMHECLGAWAAKLKMYGLISDDVKEWQYEYQPGERRHSLDGGWVREVEWWIVVSDGCVGLVELVERARVQPANHEAKRMTGPIY